MKYTHSIRDYVKERATVREVFSMEGMQFKYNNRTKCPFCGGDLTIKDSINYFQCWSCGKKGDSINLYMDLYNLDFKEAVIALAERFGYIEPTGESQKLVKVEVKQKEVKEKEEDKKELSKEQVELYDVVYEVLADVCQITPADYVYITKRGIKGCKMRDFFSLRFVDDVKLGKLTQICTNKYGYTLEDIAKVPGFYLENGKLQLKKLYGVALKARNSEGKVIGIQVRTNMEDRKYLWLSSDNKGGTSCGAPVSVDYPFNAIHSEDMEIKELIQNSASTVFIGEGKFKGCAINKEFNSIAISLAGVNSWRGRVKQELDYIDNVRKVKSIMLSFDADMCYNFKVADQFIKMMNEELESYKDRNVRVAIWNIRYGKGIDDILDNGFRKKLKSIPFDEFAEKYKAFKNRCEKINLDDDKHDERTMLYNSYFNL